MHAQDLHTCSVPVADQISAVPAYPNNNLIAAGMKACACHADAALALEEKGLAFTFSAVRAAYAAGGDCESDVRVDVRNLAAFVRDPAACVTCFLLPLTCTLHLQSQVILLLSRH